MELHDGNQIPTNPVPISPHQSPFVLFLMHRSATGNVSHRPRLQNLFWQMDDDESGTLTAEEMQQLVKDS